ncbi:MAG: sugar phosphate isomerase/epimerase [Alphaproteobacteria bacterium]|nr:MAG: sugar phosphate isomerase/epimerase [Alphaproteobacteria bacterium]
MAEPAAAPAAPPRPRPRAGRPAGAQISLLDLPRLRPWLDEGPRDLELPEFVFASVLRGDWRAFVRRARELLAGWQGRLGIHGPFSGFEIDSRDPEVAAIVRARLDSALDVCAELGAGLMVIHSPFDLWDRSYFAIRPRSARGRIEAAAGILAPVCERAEALGVRIAIENIRDADPAQRMAIVEAVDSPALGLSGDTGHALWAHVNAGAPPPDIFVRAAGRRLFHVHLADTDGWADRHWPPGEGRVPWPAVLDAIRESGADPHLIIEINEPDRIPAAAAFLDGL